MVAEQVRNVVGERISERICEQIADVHVPQVVKRTIEVPKMAEQSFDIPVPEMVEQKLPETVSDDRIQQWTAEHIAVIPVPQDVKELMVVFRVFSQDRIQQRTVEQTIPATSLAEMIVEVPVIQTQGRTQQGVTTHVQHVVNVVEVERPKIIKQTGQKTIIQDKINQVTQHVEVPLSQFNDKVVDNPVVAQRQIYMVLTVQKSIEIPQLQVTDQVVDVPVVVVAQVPQVHVEKKTVEIIQLQPVVQVPRVLVVEKTTEIPQFWFNTSKPGDEQISFKEYVDRMKEGQNDISHITDESIAVVSSSSFRENLRRKGYEVLYMADPVDEFAVQQPKECDGTKLKSTMKEDLEADIAKHAGAAASMQQPHRSQEQQTVQGRRVEREREKQGEEEKGVAEKRKKEERELDGKEERRGTEGERGKEEEGKENEVEKDVTGWTEVTRNKRKKMVQIFVKVDGMKTVAMEVSPEDKVQKILNIISKGDRDVYVTSGGRILRGSDKLKSCGVRDGSAVQVMSRMRGGGNTRTKRVRRKRSKSRNWTTGCVRWRASK